MPGLDAFCKAAPATLQITEQPHPATPYKYFLCGKGCVLGVLFEDSEGVYFEWIAENGRAVSYPPRLRYKAWAKRDVARLVCAGTWQIESAPPAASGSAASGARPVSLTALEPFRRN